MTFATGRTGTAIQNKHGLEGLAVWAAIIAAGKRGRGQIVFAHDADWQAIGLFSAPTFTLREFLQTTGRMKQTRCTRHGHVMYVQLTHYEDWNDDSHRGFERERKARSEEENHRKNAGERADENRSRFAGEAEQEAEIELERTGSPRTSTKLATNGLPDLTIELQKILDCCKDADTRSLGTLLAAANGLTLAAVVGVRESCKSYRGRVGVGYAVNALKSERKKAT
ncbi:MAG: hypothetical protein NUW01_02800 [Gemmatimonadaceae bacterium]|nr:hypothetical protein [Gemmatimonadaceae bacterium]